MHRILVTGASGFVGSHLRLALRQGFPDSILVAATRGEAVSGWDSTVHLDLADPQSCSAVIQNTLPDAIIHLGAISEPGRSFKEPLLTWQINLCGTLALAEAVLATAPKACFVFASSAEVYGLSFQEGCPVSEDTALRPANPYAASKAAADLAIGEMALRGLRALRIRPFNHTGAGQSEGFVVAAFARQVALIEAGRLEPILRVGALDRWRDFVDVSDVCAGYVTALQKADLLAPGTVINLASGMPRNIGIILEDLLRIAAINPRIETEPQRLRPTDVLRTEGNNDRARNLLEWEPRIPWDLTLTSVLDDWRERILASI